MTNESVDATKRMRTLAEETNQMGVDTLVTLNEQGEQLDSVERRLDEINLDMRQADKNLTELEKFCGCCTCICCAPKNIEKMKQHKRVYGKKANKEAAVRSQPRSSKGTSKGSQKPFVKRITDDEREDEIEENLEVVSGIVGNLKGIAEEMGGEIDRQNEQMDDRIALKVVVNSAHVEEANRRIKRQM